MTFCQMQIFGDCLTLEVNLVGLCDYSLIVMISNIWHKFRKLLVVIPTAPWYLKLHRFGHLGLQLVLIHLKFKL